MTTAENVQVQREADQTTVNATVEGTPVSVSFNTHTFLHNIVAALGRVPTPDEFWNKHVAGLLHNQYSQTTTGLIGDIYNNAPKTIDLPASDNEQTDTNNDPSMPHGEVTVGGTQTQR